MMKLNISDNCMHLLKLCHTIRFKYIFSIFVSRSLLLNDHVYKRAIPNKFDFIDLRVNDHSPAL